MEKSVTDGLRDELRSQDDLRVRDGQMPQDIRQKCDGDPGAELLSMIDSIFLTDEKDIRSYSPLTFAFIGDAVYEILVRSMIVRRGNAPVSRLNHQADEIERATRQSAIITAVEADLTEEEHQIYIRGRNAKSPTRARHASVADYRRATGLEALVGYLYLTGRLARAAELIRSGIEQTK